MRRGVSLNLPIRLVIVAALVGSAAIFLGRSTSPPNHQRQSALSALADVQSPTVFVETQSGSPLRVILVEIQPAADGTSELVFELTNLANKPIRAYTIQQRVTVGEKQRTEGLFNDLSLSDLSLPPESSRREATIVEAQNAKPTISLSVDFVEFADGTAWGSDSSSSAERLKGQRAGYISSANRLKEKFKKEGATGLTKALEEDLASSSTPTGHSLDWEAGFKSGEGIAISRLKKTIELGGMKEAEVLLNKNPSWKEQQ